MSIIVRTYGGLGNQMFQYAFGRALAVHQRTDLLLDTTWHNAHPERPYALKAFQLKARLATKEQIEKYRQDQQLFGKLKRGWQGFLPYSWRYYLKEKNIFAFQPQVFQAGPNVYLDGFWQNHKYFETITEVLRKDFQLKRPLSPKAVKYDRNIKRTKAVAVHVRCGDYLHDPAINSCHGTCSKAYYKQAVRLLQKKFTGLTYFIFSDDPSWAKNNLQGVFPKAIFIDTLAAAESLCLMSQCEHAIIANSSFSWWGAWLNPCQDKCIIAPRQWFKDSALLKLSPVPPKWVKI